MIVKNLTSKQFFKTILDNLDTLDFCNLGLHFDNGKYCLFYSFDCEIFQTSYLSRGVALPLYRKVKHILLAK